MSPDTACALWMLGVMVTFGLIALVAHLVDTRQWRRQPCHPKVHRMPRIWWWTRTGTVKQCHRCKRTMWLTARRVVAPGGFYTIREWKEVK